MGELRSASGGDCFMDFRCSALRDAQEIANWA